MKIKITDDELNAVRLMSDTEIRIAIAEWFDPSTYNPEARHSAAEAVWQTPSQSMIQCPNYCTDFWAIQTAKTKLDGIPAREMFAAFLFAIVVALEASEVGNMPATLAGCYCISNATPRQQAEALVLTIVHLKDI
jgi:hypothetical protein